MKNLDGVSFDEVYEAFRPLIEKSAKNCVKGTHGLNSEEVAVKLVEALSKAFDTYDAAKGVNFPAYAKRCVYNAAVSEHRRGMKKSVRTAKFDDGYAGGIQTGAPSSVSLDSLDYSVLSGYENKVFSLRRRGLSYAEIARKVGKSEKSVDNALRRAKEKLKKTLKR